MGFIAGSPIRTTGEMTQRVNPPTTYAEWSACLECFDQGRDDADILRLMKQGSLSWTSGVANMFSERISTTFNARLQRCADQLTRDLRTGTDELTLVRAMLGARRMLATLYQLAVVPSFPPLLRDHLLSELKAYATRSQQSLEDSAKHDRSGRLASIIRNNSLLRYDEAAAMETGGAQPAACNASSMPMSQSGPRKRNILI